MCNLIQFNCSASLYIFIGKHIPAHLFSDFESWEAGTYGWMKGGGYNSDWQTTSRGVSFLSSLIENLF